MRKWLKDVYVKLPKAPQIKRIRPQVEIRVKDVPVTYGVDDHFTIRMYRPIEETASRKLRPALIMLHGGGWIHGYPEIDEGICLTPQSYLVLSNDEKIYRNFLHQSYEL
jgi:acetyl esterase/lipase